MEKLDEMVGKNGKSTILLTYSTVSGYESGLYDERSVN